MSVCHKHYCTVILYPIDPADVEVDFSWGASSGVVEGYKIYWGTVTGGPYSFKLCDVGKDTLYCTTRLDDDQIYYLICRAYNDFGESGDSNEVIWPKE